MMCLGTYVGRVRVNNSCGNLQPAVCDPHAESAADPTCRLRVADAHALDDCADGQQQSEPESVEPRLRRPFAVVAEGVLVDQEVDEPPRISLADGASDQRRDAEDEACLDNAEVVHLSEHERA